jgi:hypothetical protein
MRTWFLVLAVPVSFALIGLIILDWIDWLLRPRNHDIFGVTRRQIDRLPEIHDAPYDWDKERAA